MGIFEVRDIVVIPFPYTDLSASKMRPALIIADLDNRDYILLQITSASYGDIYSILISSGDLSTGNLKFDSYVKYSKIFTASCDIITKKIAKINNSKYEEIIGKIIYLLKNH